MKKYAKPVSQEYDVHSEGMIAASIVIGDTPGNQQLSERHEGWSCEDWTGEEK